MESTDLLARENEFKKLNKQLEKRTQSLMKEIESVMQKPDIFSSYTPTLKLESQDNIRKHSCQPQKKETESTKPKVIKKGGTLTSNSHTSLSNRSIPSEDDDCRLNRKSTPSKQDCACCMDRRDKTEDSLQFLYAFVSLNVQENVLPQHFLKDRAVSFEVVCKFLASKIKLLQEQTEKLKSSLEKKNAQCERHLSSQAQLESQRLSLVSRSNSSKAEAQDARNRCILLQQKLDEKDRLYRELRSETDKQATEIKKLRSNSVQAESLCKGQERTIASLKQQLEAIKTTAKEIRESQRSATTDQAKEVSALKDKVKNLNRCLRTNLELIDNLRRQNALLATEGVLKALETDYCTFLQGFK